MKKLFLSLVISALGVFFSASLFAQTAGTLSVSFMPVAQSPCYSGTKNVLAAWIETSAGAFVKTKLDYWGGGTSDHLPTWSVNAGGSAGNCSTANKTDATSGATLTSFTAKSFVWDGKNVSGTSNGTLVADGTYKVCLQATWNHGTTSTYSVTFSFTKGPTSATVTPTDTKFSNISIIWTPSVTATNPTVTATPSNVKCYGGNTGSATATVNGTAPYTYTWTTTPVQTTATVTGLTAGTYSVTVKDANGTSTSAVTVTQPAAALSASVSVTNAGCGSSNGSATASASGGTAAYSYAWSNGQVTATATGLAVNTYTVVVTDANGCSITKTANIINSGAPTLSVTTTNAGCGASNGTATAHPSGGTGSITYAWSNGQATATATGLAANTYTVTITDAGGCSATSVATVVNPNGPSVVTTPTNATSCSASDGSVTSSVSGGTAPYAYAWSSGQVSSAISGVAAGNYTLTVTDQAGCKQTSIATVSCTTTSTLDAGVNAVGNPNGSMCTSTISPIVNIKNFGSPTLTSCTINYYVDAPPASTFNWNGSLASGAAVNVALPSISGIAMGAHTFYSSTSNPNGSTDANTSNDQKQSTFNVTNTTSAIPIVEGFESSTSLPTGWTLVNPDNDAAWQVVSTVSNGGTNSIGFDNCDGNGAGVSMAGTKDRFITSAYDFTSATATARMTFDVAYALLNYKNQTYPDTLAIYASNDCGTTWNQIYFKGGSTLANSVTPLTCWQPTASDWRNDVVSLGSYAGQGSVMFAFENRSGWGEWIYIDNINIEAITAVETINPLSGFNIYPNPAATSFTLDGVSKAERIRYSIYNVVGAEIKVGNVATSGGSFNGKIFVNDIPRGMYFIKVSDGKNEWTKKLNVQ